MRNGNSEAWEGPHTAQGGRLRYVPVWPGEEKMSGVDWTYQWQNVK